jgi:two-component system sensor histidine kinase KdpD
MDDQNHSNPDVLLEQFRAEEKKRRGKLKIFFGYAAGVGKTYQMLHTAQSDAINGTDVLLGYVEPHGRPETEALVLGLDILPVKIIEYHGVKLREFNLDAALAAKPTLILVDELAHTNAPGSRHLKRWQDVQELLDAGINVYTTLNVQHLESLNDIIAQITGISVSETLPDTVFDTADEIEIVDISQDELLERLRQGKVYIPAQAQRAVQNFFKKPNLIALRELTLRRTADRINRQTQTATSDSKTAKSRPTTERLLVCVGPSPTSAAVIRSAKRFALSMRAEWIAVSVETPRTADMSEKARQQLIKNLRLAEQLGAETVTLGGERIIDEIMDYAKSRNVTKIVVGKTNESWWLLHKSIVNELIRRSGDIDIYVIHGVEESSEPAVPHVHKRTDWTGRFYALFGIAVATLFNCVLWYFGLAEANLIMTYMLAIVFIAARFGRDPAIWASIAGVLTFDFFFVPPYLKFAVNDTQYLLTFIIMLTIALIISTLTSRLHRQTRLSRQREQRTESLYHLSHELAGIVGRQQLLTAAEHRLTETFGADVTIFMPDETNRLRPMTGGHTSFANNPNEIAVAQWVFEHNQIAGRGTETLSSAMALYVPLVSPQRATGVIGIRSDRMDQLLAPAQRQFLETFASQIALAIERDTLSEQAQKILIQAENERLRRSNRPDCS